MIKEYEKLMKKYNLPDYKAFNEEFEIQALDLEKCGLLHKAILRVVLARISNFLATLDPITSPNPQSIHSMIESSNINDADKQEIFNFYKELSFIYHQGCESELGTEKEIVGFINTLWKNWKNIKQKQRLILTKITKSWSKNVS